MVNRQLKLSDFIYKCLILIEFSSVRGNTRQGINGRDIDFNRLSRFNVSGISTRIIDIELRRLDKWQVGKWLFRLAMESSVMFGDNISRGIFFYGRGDWINGVASALTWDISFCTPKALDTSRYCSSSTSMAVKGEIGAAALLVGMSSSSFPVVGS